MDAPAPIPTQHQNFKSVAKFLYREILMSDKGGHFVSQIIQAMIKNIRH